MRFYFVLKSPNPDTCQLHVLCFVMNAAPEASSYGTAASWWCPSRWLRRSWSRPGSLRTWRLRWRHVCNGLAASGDLAQRCPPRPLPASRWSTRTCPRTRGRTHCGTLTSAAVKNYYLNLEERRAEQTPLPGAREEDPDAVVAALGLQREPLVQKERLQSPGVVAVSVSAREEAIQSLGDERRWRRFGGCIADVDLNYVQATKGWRRRRRRGLESVFSSTWAMRAANSSARSLLSGNCPRTICLLTW